MSLDPLPLDPADHRSRIKNTRYLPSHNTLHTHDTPTYREQHATSLDLESGYPPITRSPKSPPFDVRCCSPWFPHGVQIGTRYWMFHEMIGRIQVSVFIFHVRCFYFTSPLPDFPLDPTENSSTYFPSFIESAEVINAFPPFASPRRHSNATRRANSVR